MWAQTHQSIFWVERAEVAVADNFVATVAWGYQQVLGRGLIANWEPDPDRALITKLGPADVLTTEEAAKLLDPWIQPLPSFEERVLGRSPAAA